MTDRDKILERMKEYWEEGYEQGKLDERASIRQKVEDGFLSRAVMRGDSLKGEGDDKFIITKKDFWELLATLTAVTDSSVGKDGSDGSNLPESTETVKQLDSDFCEKCEPKVNALLDHNRKIDEEYEKEGEK